MNFKFKYNHNFKIENLKKKLFIKIIFLVLKKSVFKVIIYYFNLYYEKIHNISPIYFYFNNILIIYVLKENNTLLHYIRCNIFFIF